MDRTRNLLPHTDRRPDGYTVKGSDGNTQTRFRGEIEDYVEAGFDAVVLVGRCLAYIAAGIAFVLLVWL